jgi:hypothetical protein
MRSGVVESNVALGASEGWSMVDGIVRSSETEDEREKKTSSYEKEIRSNHDLSNLPMQRQLVV